MTKEEKIVKVLKDNEFIELVGHFDVKSTGDIRIFEHDHTEGPCTDMCMIIGKGNSAWFLWYKDNEEMYDTKLHYQLQEIEDDGRGHN